MFVFQEYNSLATKTTRNIPHHMSISTAKMLVLCCTSHPTSGRINGTARVFGSVNSRRSSCLIDTFARSHSSDSYGQGRLVWVHKKKWSARLGSQKTTVHDFVDRPQ
jgi:hypothetical protein